MMWHARTSQASPAAPQALPTPSQLASLGPVLCLYRVQPGGALSGWAQAARSEVVCRVDRDGPCESVHFFDATGRSCWRLYLLPDSDFLAWDGLTARLQARHDAAPHAARWHRLDWRARRERWFASVLHLRAPDAPAAAESILADRTHVSAFGLSIATRIARSEGLATDVVAADCCCLHAAHPRH